MNYIDHIKAYHCLVSFSHAKSIFYISLWNGILRDGKVDDIDIDFYEAKHPIINHSLSFLSFHNKNISLSPIQLKHLSSLFPESH
jgi:hypothetical protein